MPRKDPGVAPAPRDPGARSLVRGKRRSRAAPRLPLVGLRRVAPREHCVRPDAIGFAAGKAHLDRNGNPRRQPMSSRTITRRVRGIPTSDGAGVELTRVIGQPMLDSLDPFLMLDAFGSDAATDYIAGFPDHPHRGFETVTIMLDGRMRHRDSVGNVGLLEAGSVQWMTAGRGIIHSEMPEQQEGRMAGFQLWVNLAAKDKMTAPEYHDIAPSDIPVVALDGGVRVRVIAGESHGTPGAVERPTTEPVVLDIT